MPAQLHRLTDVDTLMCAHIDLIPSSQHSHAKALFHVTIYTCLSPVFIRIYNTISHSLFSLGCRCRSGCQGFPIPFEYNGFCFAEFYLLLLFCRRFLSFCGVFFSFSDVRGAGQTCVPSNIYQRFVRL